MHSFWLLAFPLYLGWYCLGAVAPRPALISRGVGGLAYHGLVLGVVGILLPVPWLALRAALPEASAGGLLLGLVVVLGCMLYPLAAWLLLRHSVSALRQGLLWTSHLSVLAWLLYGWL